MRKWQVVLAKTGDTVLGSLGPIGNSTTVQSAALRHVAWLHAATTVAGQLAFVKAQGEGCGEMRACIWTGSYTKE